MLLYIKMPTLVGNKERRQSPIIKKRIKSPVPMKERWFMRFFIRIVSKYVEK